MVSKWWFEFCGERSSATPFFTGQFNLNFTSLYLSFTSFYFNPCSTGNLEPRFEKKNKDYRPLNSLGSAFVTKGCTHLKILSVNPNPPQRHFTASLCSGWLMVRQGPSERKGKRPGRHEGSVILELLWKANFPSNGEILKSLTSLMTLFGRKSPRKCISTTRPLLKFATKL